jgi:DNA-binding winged helix-turn-helix (wHTH) protein
LPADLFAFGPFELDAASRRLLKNGEAVVLPPRQFDLLVLMVARAGQLLSKDALIEAAWDGIAVTDNSLEQAISGLRRILGAADGIGIETQARRGYRFTGAVRRIDRRAPAEALEVLLAPHRAWIEGRAALETLERSHILHARAVFEQVLAQVPDQASAHVGLANAGVMQFEMTRSEREPDVGALTMAAAHARDACRLDPQYGEAWATLGFILDRTGQRGDALAASRRAVSLEPDNWRHRLRLAYVSWGEERLREARRTLALLPGFPLAHWLAATVHVARQALDAAERELRNGIASQADGDSAGRFSGVALHWLLGLILLARDDERGALEEFACELATEQAGQLYARECCANTWYAIGAIHIRRGEQAAAAAAFTETLDRVPQHPLARAALGHAPVVLDGDAASRAADANVSPTPDPARALPMADIALARAVSSVLRGDVPAAVQTVDLALTNAPDGSALWTVPVEPLLRIGTDSRWASPLARLRNRAA